MFRELFNQNVVRALRASRSREVHIRCDDLSIRRTLILVSVTDGLRGFCDCGEGSSYLVPDNSVKVEQVIPEVQVKWRIPGLGSGSELGTTSSQWDHVNIRSVTIANVGVTARLFKLGQYRHNCWSFGFLITW